MKITEDNYELYLFQYAEGMLSNKECREVEAFLDSHPDIREEFALYDPKLTVARLPKMKYEGKAALKHNTFALWPVLRYAAAVLLLAGVATFFMLRNNGSAPDSQTIVTQNQIDSTAPQPLQDTTQDAETTEQPQTAPVPVRHVAQHAISQQIATNATPVSESVAENETTQTPQLLAENTDSTMQNNDSQNFIPYKETPTKVVYTDQIITYSQYAPVEEPAYKQDKMELFLKSFGPIQTFKDMKNDIASLLDYLNDGTENLLMFFSPSKNKQSKNL